MPDVLAERVAKLEAEVGSLRREIAASERAAERAVQVAREEQKANQARGFTIITIGLAGLSLILAYAMRK